MSSKTLLIVAVAILGLMALAGIGLPDSRSVSAVAASGTFNASAISAGYLHNCALVSDSDTTRSTVRCWGDNSLNEMGIATSGNLSTAPADVCSSTDGFVTTGSTNVWKCTTPFREAVALGVGSAAYSTCVLVPPPQGQSNYAVKCWGDNDEGQLGDGTTTNRTTPVSVCAAVGSCGSSVLTNVAAVADGADHTCALMNDQTVKCWGQNDRGQLGDGTTTNATAPVNVCATGSGGSCTLLTNVLQVSVNNKYSCALLVDTTAKCWGNNTDAQLGNGTRDSVGTPHSNPESVCVVYSSGCTQVLSGAHAVSAGGAYHFHACALVDATSPSHNYEARCWGNDAFEQVGNGVGGCTQAPYCTTAVPVCAASGCPAHLQDVATVAAGGYHTCVLMTDSTAQCWGVSAYGELGTGNPPAGGPIPAPVCASSGCPSFLTGVVSISTGYFHTCVLTGSAPNYDASCFGWAAYGQQGNGTVLTNQFIPGSVLLDSDRDGCPDLREINVLHSNPNNFWDFFDTPDTSGVRDRIINSDDTSRVQARFSQSGSTQIDPLSKPVNSSTYHTGYDRQGGSGTAPWNVAGPDGRVTVADILIVSSQAAGGYSCQ